MTNILNKITLRASAAFMAGILVAVPGTAQAGPAGQSFADVAENIGTSLRNFPQLIAIISYIVGLLLGVLGVLKVKDHVENPGNTPLKDGAIRLASGGALLSLPMLYEAMENTFGTTSFTVSPSSYIGGATASVNWD